MTSQRHAYTHGAMMASARSALVEPRAGARLSLHPHDRGTSTSPGLRLPLSHALVSSTSSSSNNSINGHEARPMRPTQRLLSHTTTTSRQRAASSSAQRRSPIKVPVSQSFHASTPRGVRLSTSGVSSSGVAKPLSTTASSLPGPLAAAGRHGHWDASGSLRLQPDQPHPPALGDAHTAASPRPLLAMAAPQDPRAPGLAREDAGAPAAASAISPRPRSMVLAQLTSRMSRETAAAAACGVVSRAPGPPGRLTTESPSHPSPAAQRGLVSALSALQMCMGKSTAAVEPAREEDWSVTPNLPRAEKPEKQAGGVDSRSSSFRVAGTQRLSSSSEVLAAPPVGSSGDVAAAVPAPDRESACTGPKPAITAPPAYWGAEGESTNISPLAAVGAPVLRVAASPAMLALSAAAASSLLPSLASAPLAAGSGVAGEEEEVVIVRRYPPPSGGGTGSIIPKLPPSSRSSSGESAGSAAVAMVREWNAGQPADAPSRSAAMRAMGPALLPGGAAPPDSIGYIPGVATAAPGTDAPDALPAVAPTAPRSRLVLPSGPAAGVLPNGPAAGSPSSARALASSLAQSAPSSARAPQDPAPRGLVGLNNLGNTCFMNSILQCLSHVPPLRRYFTSGAFRAHVCSSSRSRPQSEVTLLFGELLAELWSEQHAAASAREGLGSSFHPQRLKRAVAAAAPRFDGFDQHDSHELLTFMLDALVEGTNRAAQKLPYRELGDAALVSDSDTAAEWWQYHTSRSDSNIWKLFAGQSKTMVACDVCGNTSRAFDPFLDLQVSIPQSTARGRAAGNATVTLADCMEEFVAPERLAGSNEMYCRNCRCHRSGRKVTTLFRLPDVLIVQLKRFSQSGWRRSKLDTRIEFPLTGLDVAGCCEPGSPFVKGTVYDCVAMSNHSGTLGGGHYTADCVNCDDDRWYSFNDSRVGPSSFRSDSPALSSSSAYVLFYVRRSVLQRSRLGLPRM